MKKKILKIIDITLLILLILIMILGNIKNFKDLKESKKNMLRLTEYETVGNNLIGLSGLKEIGDGLYYDTHTGIIYWWGGEKKGSNEMPSVYYSKNGKLCRYMAGLSSVEEIE